MSDFYLEGLCFVARSGGACAPPMGEDQAHGVGVLRALQHSHAPADGLGKARLGLSGLCGLLACDGGQLSHVIVHGLPDCLHLQPHQHFS